MAEIELDQVEDLLLENPENDEVTYTIGVFARQFLSAAWQKVKLTQP
jgi:hypothetical protein